MIVKVRATLVTSDRDIGVTINFNPGAARHNRIEVRGLPRVGDSHTATAVHWMQQGTLVLPLALAVELEIAEGPSSRSDDEHEDLCDSLADQLRVALAATHWTVL